MEPIALTPKEEQVETKVEDKGGHGSPVIEHTKLYEYFGVKASNARADEALGKIWEYAKSVAANKDAESVAFEVLRLKSRLGAPSLGEKPWSRVEVYVNNWLRMREADKRMRELEASS